MFEFNTSTVNISNIIELLKRSDLVGVSNSNQRFTSGIAIASSHKSEFAKVISCKDFKMTINVNNSNVVDSITIEKSPSRESVHIDGYSVSTQQKVELIGIADEIIARSNRENNAKKQSNLDSFCASIGKL